ncbi:hypothetical protein VKA52_12875 [Halobacillus sp. HZG1]|uniref:hypothetical protein n=1 Tax=Halobacillus sp. HZG1 TaxID=3111769 RepID=UPI002DB72557|nr:hypothetical protein [Halobacillus sp. HZG1]MEC3884620.1 hypothetical protein [Halobacillus sp. HZG1]
MLDGYQLFMEKFNIDEEEMIEFGINKTIVIPDDQVRKEWEFIKGNIYSGDEKIYVRGYGRNAAGTELYLNLYEKLFGHKNFHMDPTNNTKPTKLLRELSGYSRQEKPTSKYNRIRNFQVSHIFGRTKNPYLFTAPWNVVYVPKVMDPFTGHESKGELTKKFQERFLNYYYSHFEHYIKEYNSIMDDLQPKLEDYLFNNGSDITKKFKEDARAQFSLINLK